MINPEFNNANNNNHNKTDDFNHPKHSLRHKQTERKIRKKRKQIKSLKAFSRFVVLLLLIFLGYKIFKLPQWYLPKDALKKQNSNVVEIMNNKIIPSYVISNTIKDIKVPNRPIFLISVNPIKKTLYKQIPLIKNIYVRRYGFPARIQIIIRERTPIAVIKTDLKSMPAAIFTSDGILIPAKKYMTIQNSENVLKILSSSTNLNKDWSVQKVKDIEEIVKAVEQYSNEKVEYIDMRNPNDVYVKIKTTSIRLGALDSTVFERIKRIYTILPQIKEVDSQIRYIDLSWDKVNYLKLKKSK